MFATGTLKLDINVQSKTVAFVKYYILLTALKFY
jgi:hypothetical protein